MKLLYRSIKKSVLGTRQKDDEKNYEVADEQHGKFCLSLRFLFFSNLLAGHWFAVSALRIRPGTLAYVLSYVNFFFSHAVMIAYSYFSITNAVNNYEHTTEIKMSNIAMSIIGVLGIVLAFWRTCCIIVNQHKVMNLVANVLNSDYIDRTIISNAARKCIWFLIFYSTIYSSFLVLGTISVLNFGEDLYAGRNDANSTQEHDVKKYLNTTFSIYGAMAEEASHETFKILVILFNLAGIVELSKFVLTDVINYLFYYISIDLYEKLGDSLETSLNSKSNDQVEIWLAQHHYSNMFFEKVNEFTSASVIGTVVLCTLQACTIDYVVALRLLMTAHSIVMFVFGFLALLQIFIYCYFGHKIRKLVAAIKISAYRASWMKGSKEMQNAAIMIANATGSPQCISQIGAPFFSLSMEFFTSIVGVICTYFLILLQFK